MPIIYLSPSTQEGNYYVTGGTEEQYMNQLADAMIPYLDASGIGYTRNMPGMTAAGSIAASNAGNYDLHLALHSNAAPDDRYGSVRGSIVFYYPGSLRGQRAAGIITDGLKAIYPIPNLVRSEGTTTIGEVRLVRAPSVFLELAYHDNEDDANWITQNIPAIARNLVLSLTEYFDIPFFETSENRPGSVAISFGVLNIRSRPNLSAPILARVPKGAPLLIQNRYNNWYLVNYGDTVGYAAKDYISLN